MMTGRHRWLGGGYGRTLPRPLVRGPRRWRFPNAILSQFVLPALVGGPRMSLQTWCAGGPIFRLLNHGLVHVFGERSDVVPMEHAFDGAAAIHAELAAAIMVGK